MKRTIVILVAFLTIFIYSFSLSYSFDSNKSWLLSKEELFNREQFLKKDKNQQHITIKNTNSFVKNKPLYTALKAYVQSADYTIGYSVYIERDWEYRDFWSGNICLETYPQSYWEWYVSFNLIKYWFWSNTNYGWRTVKVNNYRRTVKWSWVPAWEFKLRISAWAGGSWIFDNSARIYNCD